MTNKRAGQTSPRDKGSPAGAEFGSRRGDCEIRLSSQPAPAPVRVGTGKLGEAGRGQGGTSVAWPGRSGLDTPTPTGTCEPGSTSAVVGRPGRSTRARHFPIASRSGRTTVAAYVEDWLAHRKDLRPTTADKYRHLFTRHIAPALGTVELGKLNAERVRHWFRALAAEHATTANDSYRFLRAVLNTAVEDGKIASNPCRIKGAGTVRAAERPTIDPAALLAAVEAAPERYRLALLLASWCQLRRGEILGLQRRHVDLTTGTLAIQQARTVTTAGTPAQGPPKTAAGVRRIQVPANVLPALRDHLDRFVASSPDASLFTAEHPAGSPISPRTLDRIWQHARTAIGQSSDRVPLHLHDLRHSGLSWAAATGASTAQLMARAGHASPAAALRYQHATQDQDGELARRLAPLAAS